MCTDWTGRKKVDMIQLALCWSGNLVLELKSLQCCFLVWINTRCINHKPLTSLKLITTLVVFRQTVAIIYFSWAELLRTLQVDQLLLLPYPYMWLHGQQTRKIGFVFVKELKRWDHGTHMMWQARSFFSFVLQYTKTSMYKLSVRMKIEP